MTDREILSSADAVAQRAADIVIEAAQEAVARRGRFTLSLTGGPSPRQAYQLLARPERASQIDWSKTYVFWGDERVGGPEDPECNYATAKRLLLAHVPIPGHHVFPAALLAETMERQAEKYAASLAHFFQTPVHGLPPSFDLFLLGLGEDGHVNSLFPDADTLSTLDRWVVSTPPGTLPPPVGRVTTTFPVINAARHVLFIVTGGGRAEAVHDILEGGAPLERRPALGVPPPDGRTTWLLDSDAAGRLRHS